MCAFDRGEPAPEGRPTAASLPARPGAAPLDTPFGTPFDTPLATPSAAPLRRQRRRRRLAPSRPVEGAMSERREGVLDDEAIVERLKAELPHWRYEDGWIRR